MQVFLDHFAASLGPKVQVILRLDRAGWHVTTRLQVPPKLTLLFLPPYAPELNPVERVWLFLRDRFLSHRVFANPQAVARGCSEAWRRLRAIPPRLASLTNYPYLRKVKI
jgi:transposase